MPAWEYVCLDCHRTDIKLFRSAEERDVIENAIERPHCTACGGSLRRKPSAGSFILRGTGFHANDHPSRRT